MIQVSIHQLRRLHLMIIISQWSIWIVFRKINPYRTSSTVENQIMFYHLRQKRQELLRLIQSTKKLKIYRPKTTTIPCSFNFTRQIS